MSSSVRRCAALLATFILSTSASAQVLTSSFGPGVAFGTAGTVVGEVSNRQVAQDFLFEGPAAKLAQVQLSLLGFAIPGIVPHARISFLVGPTRGAASELESWTFPVTTTTGVVTLSSVLQPDVVTGSRYWLSAAAPDGGFFGWYLSLEGTGSYWNNLEPSFPAGEWHETRVGSPLAVLVTVQRSSSVPEPAGAVLMLTGIACLAGRAGVRRR